MPKIIDSQIISILETPYFDHHAAMHLTRERQTIPAGFDRELLPDDVTVERSKDGQLKVPLILPHSACDDCNDMEQMTEVGEPGSGIEFLQMHHEMIRVFRFLLNQKGLVFLPDYHDTAGPSLPTGPVLWDLDDPDRLPHEIKSIFSVTDPDYLRLVFCGVGRLTQRDPVLSLEGRDGAIDRLGRFIERGVAEGEPIDGSGFHDTMHEFIAAHERKAAQGAEMNKLNKARFNDYFWSLHLWIESQYERLVRAYGAEFDTDPLDPETLDMFTHAGSHGEMPDMNLTIP